MSQAESTETLKRTPLTDTHAALGAKLVPFAGYLMPVQYPSGITAEHNAVRSYAGLFDVSHMILAIGYRHINKVNWQLQQTNQELLQLMVAAIEARDPYTSGHSRRVARNARLIAKAIGLPDRQVERVAVAALLHDVGKIHEVFAPILSKPGRLTAEENAIMQTHPIKSEELVKTVSQLSDVVAPIRHHHENWDGTGYPDGLVGEAIPIASRIIMSRIFARRAHRAITTTIILPSFLRNWQNKNPAIGGVLIFLRNESIT